MVSEKLLAMSRKIAALCVFACWILRLWQVEHTAQVFGAREGGAAVTDAGGAELIVGAGDKRRCGGRCGVGRGDIGAAADAGYVELAVNQRAQGVEYPQLIVVLAAVVFPSEGRRDALDRIGLVLAWAAHIEGAGDLE